MLSKLRITQATRDAKQATKPQRHRTPTTKPAAPTGKKTRPTGTYLHYRESRAPKLSGQRRGARSRRRRSSLPRLVRAGPSPHRRAAGQHGEAETSKQTKMGRGGRHAPSQRLAVAVTKQSRALFFFNRRRRWKGRRRGAAICTLAHGDSPRDSGIARWFFEVFASAARRAALPGLGWVPGCVARVWQVRRSVESQLVRWWRRTGWKWRCAAVDRSVHGGVRRVGLRSACHF
jgi:hypothetical protein